MRERPSVIKKELTNSFFSCIPAYESQWADRRGQLGIVAGLSATPKKTTARSFCGLLPAVAEK